MKGCGVTSEERKKGFSALIRNLSELKFVLEEHRVRVKEYTFFKLSCNQNEIKSN